MVELKKANKGYFLTIGDTDMPNIKNTWAISEEEAREVLRLLKAEFEE